MNLPHSQSIWPALALCSLLGCSNATEPVAAPKPGPTQASQAAPAPDEVSQTVAAPAKEPVTTPPAAKEPTAQEPAPSEVVTKEPAATEKPAKAEPTPVPVAQDLTPLIQHEIIGPQLGLTEVKAYTAARVAPLPPAKSADEWLQTGADVRKQVLEKVIFRGEAAQWRDAEVKVEWLGEVELPADAGYKIKKLRYEALPGLWIPAVLYEPGKLTEKAPVSLNVNGHDRAEGKASVQKQTRCINLAKRGVIALNVEWVGMGQLYSADFLHYLINSIDLCGTSGIAVHYLAMTRALDLLLDHEYADPTRVVVAGLSGGGWQTIFLSSLDTRVTLANPVAGYSSFLTRVEYVTDLGDSEQTPVDLAATADYATLTCMLAPRAALLTYNAKDQCCFAAPHALPPLMAVAEPIYKLFDKADLFRTHINEDPGTHNFEKDNRQQLYKMVGDVFYPGDAQWSAEEIPCDQEIQQKAALDVELPEGNASFYSLAMELAKDLPRDAEIPTDRAEQEHWRTRRRAALREVLRLEETQAKARQVGEETLGDTQAVYWQLRINDTWTVPAVMLTQGEPQGTTVLLGDAGRGALAEQAQALLANKQRVLLVDPFFLGESKINTHDFLYSILISSVGRRPLGVQAGQLTAIAQWLAAEQKSGPVTLEAHGPRTSLMALTAAALAPQAISGTTLNESFGSLKEIIELKLSSQHVPELFCFGLLEQFDIPQLKALCSP